MIAKKNFMDSPAGLAGSLDRLSKSMEVASLRP